MILLSPERRQLVYAPQKAAAATAVLLISIMNDIVEDLECTHSICLNISLSVIHHAAFSAV